MFDFLEDECAEKEHSVFLRAQDEHVPGSERQGCFTELHLLESVAAGDAEGCPEAVTKHCRTFVSANYRQMLRAALAQQCISPACSLMGLSHSVLQISSAGVQHIFLKTTILSNLTAAQVL